MGDRHDGDPELDPQRTAVVVVDMVNHQCTADAGMLAAWRASGAADPDYFLDRVERITIPAHQTLLPAARALGARVVYLKVGAYAADYGDLTPGFRGIAAWEPRADLWGAQVLDAVAPEPGDITLIKTGSGGFYTSGLDSHLRNLGIENVVYTGVITNGCVMLTAAGGFDRGYRGFIASDATATLSDELQRTTELMIDGFVATVAPVDQLVAGMHAPDATLQGRDSVRSWSAAF
jgi:nicotinamidase-related amidase